MVDNFLQDLSEIEFKWAVYNLEYEKKGVGVREQNKLPMVSWCVPCC